MTTFMPSKELVAAILTERVYHTGEMSDAGIQAITNLTGWEYIDKHYDANTGYYAEAWGHRDVTGQPFSEIMQVTRGTAFSRPSEDLPNAPLQTDWDTQNTQQIEMGANVSIIFGGSSSYADEGFAFFNQLKNSVGQNAKFIEVGHSLGGWAVGEIVQYILKNNANVDVIGWAFNPLQHTSSYLSNTPGLGSKLINFVLGNENLTQNPLLDLFQTASSFLGRPDGTRITLPSVQLADGSTGNIFSIHSVDTMIAAMSLAESVGKDAEWIADRDARFEALYPNLAARPQAIKDLLDHKATLTGDAGEVVSRNPDGSLKYVAGNVARPLLQASDVGQVFGSQLGKLVGGDNQFAQIAAGTTLGAIGRNIGQEIDAANGVVGANGRKIIGFKDFDIDLAGAGLGAVGSFLFAELLDATGIGGFEGQVLNTIGGTVIGQIATNIANHAADVFQGVGDALSIEVAFGSFLGSWLGSQVFHFDTVEGQIGASIGSALGGIAASQLLSNLFTQGAGLLLNVAIPGLGAFIGFALGGLIGSLFGGGTPRSSTGLVWDGKEFFKGPSWSVHSSTESANSLASSVAQVLNGVLTASGAQLADGWLVRPGAYGLDGSDYVYWVTGDDRTLNRVAGRFNNANDLINTGTYIGLSDMISRMVGGNVYIKRAIAANLAKANGNTATINGGSFSADTLEGHIKIAKDYSTYLSNFAVINAEIAGSPESKFAAGWLATLAAAFDLGLNMRAISDWVGGWNAFMDAAQGGEIDGETFTPGNLALSLDSSTRARTFTFSDENGGLLGSFGDTINSADKTRIAATLGSDTITVSGDTISNTTGLTIDGTAANGSAKKIDVAAVIDAGAGDDTVIAGDLGNDVLGGAGNDTLVGGKLDDWLFGDDGSDRLFAGAVATTSFTDADTTSRNAALAVDGGNGNYLEGGAGDDRLYGGTGSDWLSGGTGNDVEYGGDGGDILTGGAGSDDLQGGLGTDQYLFSFGDGADVVFDAGVADVAGTGGLFVHDRITAMAAGLVQKDWAGTGNYTTNGSVIGGMDAITFGAGISMINLEMARFGNDMVIKLGTWDSGFSTFTLTGDQLTVKDWFTDDRTIEWFRFADGEEIRMSDLGSVVRGTSGNDYIVGTDGSDFLFGLGGADSIRSLGGNDFAYGGRGDDFITGDGGDDLVIGGSGADRVQGNAGQDTLTGDDGDDNVYGGAGDDIISGGKGTDFLAGGAGNDIFKYTRGDGIDSIIDEYSNSWETVWTGTGGYQNGYTLNANGTVTKNGVTYFDDGWIGFYSYDADTQVLKRYTASMTGLISQNSGTDTIEFATGIDVQDIEFQNVNGDLIMGIMANGDDNTTFANLTDKIVLRNLGWGYRFVENLAFTSIGVLNIPSYNIGIYSEGIDTFNGSSGNDWMTGLGGDDKLYAGAGDDIVAGDQGADTLRGNAGNDVLYGGAGNDFLDGGAGNDQLIGGAGEDAASYETATSGVRVSLGYTLANSGDAAGDVFTGIEDIKGWNYADILIGDDNDNMLTGGQGNDILRGGQGDDTYVYNILDGADVINEVGISGAEEVLDAGGVLNSNYSASWTYLGTTTVSGTTYYAYRLVVTDNRTSQVVYQSRDNVDFLYLDPGHALPPGNEWAFSSGQWLLDTMRTGNGVQTVRTFDGSAGGNDALLLPNMSLSRFDISRSGADLIFTMPNSGQTVTIKNQTTSANAIERLLLLDGLTASLTNLKLTGDSATSGDDFFQGNATANTFHGMDGNDIISGRDGNDTLYGDNGDDVLEGGNGGDTLDGGSDSETSGLAPDPTNMTKPYGDTVRYVSSGAAVSVNLANRVLSGGEAAGDTIVAVNGVSTIENVTGSDGYGDTLTGDSRANRLFGLGGNDNLTGAAGDDVLVGGVGTDTLHGDDGNDNLSGGDGDDTIYGGNDNDLLSGDAGNDVLYGEAGDDTLSGGDGNDTLTASDGNDRLGGDAGADTLNGDNGDDTLSGGDGDDTLYGGAGNDTISGDAGNDIIQGGLNDDTYMFSTAAGNDTLTDTDGKNGIVITDATHDRIWLGQSGSDLMVGIIGSTASIRVVNYFAASPPVSVFSISTTDQTLFLKYADPLIAAMGAISSSAPGSMPQSIADMLPTYWDVGSKAAPRVTDQSFPEEHEDEAVFGSVGAIDHDDNIVAYATASAPAHGTLNLDTTTGAWSYTPTANYNGPDSFSIRVTDADQQSVTQTVSITLLPVPDPPDVPTITPTVTSVAERDNPDPMAPVPAAVQLGILAGTDPDLTPAEALQQLAYSVSDARFEIRNGNELWLRAGVMSSIDFEADPDPILSVTITVSDNFGTTPGALTNTGTFTFAIADQVDFFIGDQNANTLTGTPGPDYIRGNGGDDILSGLDGADTILGGTADDLVDGGDGDDYLQGDAGSDTLLGGAGNDTLLGGDDNDTLLDGGLGNDVINGGLGDDALVGGAGADTIDGGAGTDTLSYAGSSAGVTVSLATGAATGGDAEGDTITGIEHLIGSNFVDTITGTSADETFEGLDGNDVILGGDGTDIFYGGAGSDTITGGTGIDSIHGEDGDDHLIGGAGDDNLYGENANDTLEAGDGDDLLVGGAGNDILDGGLGSDSYLQGFSSGNDLIYDFDPLGTDVDQIHYADVDPSWLWFERVPNTNDLKISIIGSSATTIVVGWFDNIAPPANRQIEMVVTNTLYTIDADGLTSFMASQNKPADSAELTTLLSDNSYASGWATYWDTNMSPEVGAIADQTVNEDTPASFVVSVHDDNTPAANIVYTLKAYSDAARTQEITNFVPAEPDVSPYLGGLPNDQTVVIAPNANVSGTAYLRLEVKDLTGRITLRDFTLNVTPVADTPTLYIKDNLPNQYGTPITLYGTLTSGPLSLVGSFDTALADNDGSETLSVKITGLQGLHLNHGTQISSDEWRLTQSDLTAPGGLAIVDPNNPLSSNWSTDLVLGITATATENSGGSTASTATQTLRVNINARPTGISGSLSVAENTTSGNSPNETVVGTLTGIDPDNDKLTYTIVSSPNVPDGLFAISDTHSGYLDNTGRVTVSNAGLLNYEKLLDDHYNTLSIRVRVQDQGSPGLYTYFDVPVTITDVNEAPSLTFAWTDPVNENTSAGALVARVVASDPDKYNSAYSNFSYSLTGANAGLFTIVKDPTDPTMARIYTNASFDYEGIPSHQLSVTAVVSDGALSDQATSYVPVGDVNEAPVLNAQTSVWSAYENALTGPGTSVGTATYTDPDSQAGYRNNKFSLLNDAGGRFAIDADSGIVAVHSMLDYEAQSSYIITVRVQDQSNPSLFSDRQYSVNVTNVNETPYISGVSIATPQYYEDYNYPQSSYWSYSATFNLADPDAGDTVTLLGGWNLDYPESNVFDWTWWPYQDNPAYWPVHHTARVMDSGGLYRDYTFTLGSDGSASYAPIVLDLDGNGIDLVSRYSTTAWFDVDGDGYRDLSGWVGPNDGILALDLDGNGLIDKGDEIRFSSNVVGAVSDLEGLRAYDTNNDGLLDAGDDRFDDFRVWQDANQDGISQAGELTSLSNRSIAAINLTLTTTGASLVNQTDNVLYGTTQFVRTDSSIGTAGDASLLYQRNNFTLSLDGVLQQEFHVTPPDQLAPVVLDLDGNGVTLESRLKSEIMFDADADGTAERTGWVGANDGLLALDRNGDGIINDGSEISFKQDVAGAVSDLEGLNAYDTNQNGFFDADDERFAEFKVWRDANQDGVSTQDELKSLDDYGINAIGLTLHTTGQAIEGAIDNVLYATADVVHKDGSISTAGDVFLSYDQPEAKSLNDSALPNFAPITPKQRKPRSSPDINNPKRSPLHSGFNAKANELEPAPVVARRGDQSGQRLYDDVRQNFRALTQSAYSSLSKNALNPRGGADEWATTLAAGHGVGAQSPVDVGVGLLDQQMLQMVAAIASFNGGDSGTLDAMERARRHNEGTEFLTAVPKFDLANGHHVA